MGARGRQILGRVLRTALKASSKLDGSFRVDPALAWTAEVKDEEGDWSHDGADWHKMRLELAETILDAQREAK